MSTIAISITIPFFSSKVELDAAPETTIDELIEVGIVNTLAPEKRQHKFELFYKEKLLERDESIRNAGLALEPQPIALDCVVDRKDDAAEILLVMNVRYQEQRASIEVDPQILLIELLSKLSTAFKIPLSNPQTKLHCFFRGLKLDNGKSLFSQGFHKTMDEDDYIDVFLESIGG